MAQRKTWVGLALLLFACGGAGASPGAAAALLAAPLDSAAAASSAQQLTALPQLQSALLPVYPEDVRFGAENATVTVVAFLDFGDDFNRAHYSQLSRWFEHSGKDVRLVLKHVPSNAHGERLSEACIALQRARGDSACFDVLKRSMAGSAPPNERELTQSAFAAQVTPRTRASIALRPPQLGITEQVQRDQRLFMRIGAMRMPQFYVNGALWLSDDAWSGFERLVAEEHIAAQTMAAQFGAQAAYALRVRDNLHLSPQPLDTQSLLTETVQAPSWGSKLAPVTIVHFMDFQCPFSAHVLRSLQQVRRHYGPDRVRLVFRHNPLAFHREALPAHQVAAHVFAMGGNDAFWKFHDLAFANPHALTRENLVQWATRAGIKPALVEHAVEPWQYAPSVMEDLRLASDLGIVATPAFRINGIALSGAQPFERFQELIDLQLLKAAELRDQSIPAAQVSAWLTKQQLVVPPPKVYDSARPVDSHTWPVPIEADDPSLGPRDALVTIVLFGGLQCSFTALVQPTLKAIVKRYGNDVRIVWKDLVLPHDRRGVPAATVARAAYSSQGNAAFWKMVDELLATRKDLSDEKLVAAATRVGVSRTSVVEALATLPYGSHFERSQKLFDSLAAEGTPYFFVNGRRLVGAQSLERFTALIDHERARARALLELGVRREHLYDALVAAAQPPPPPR